MGMVGDSKLLNPALIKFFKDPLLFLIYLAGVVWFLLLSQDSLNANTYFSENALLPGLVDSELYHDYGASHLSDELEVLLKKRRAEHNYEIPSEWLLEKLKKNGLQAYSQNYTFSYPHGVYNELSEAMKGTNVYTIIRTPRSSSTEAIVINVPFNNHPSNNAQAADTNHPAIALIISLAKAFRKKSYWAKDLVFVVSDNSEVGLQAWLSSYHHIPNQYIKAQMLPARSGVIQAALVLELQAKTNGHFTIKTEGMNGKLPNLDLFNTVERLFNKEGGRSQMLEAHNTWLYQLRTSRKWKSLVNMLSMLWHLASNFPTGNHGYFLTYGIEAVTIKGMEKKGARPLELMDVAKAVEGVLRSLNNLLERFHQSFFFYLLASPSRYISIGVYMPPIGLMLLPIIIKALRIKLEISEEAEKAEAESEGEGEKKRGGEKEGAGGEKEGGEEEEGSLKAQVASVSDADHTSVRKRVGVKKESSAGDVVGGREEDQVEEGCSEGSEVVKDEAGVKDGGGVAGSSFSLLLHALMAVCIPVAFYYSSPFFIRSSRDFRVDAEDSLSMCLIIAHLSIITYPLIFKWYTRRRPMRVKSSHLYLLTLISVGLSCGPLSVVNVSLSFLILLFWTPLVLLVAPGNNYRIVTFIKACLTLLFSPACLLYAASAANLLIANKATPPSPGSAFSNLGDGLMSSLLHYSLFDLWSFPLIYFLFLPVWAFMWLCVAAPAC